jgi:hypothetical protein
MILPSHLPFLFLLFFASCTLDLHLPPVVIEVRSELLGSPLCFSSNYDSDYQNFLKTHGDSTFPSHDSEGFSIEFSAATYFPGCTYTVSLCTSSKFSGFLFYSQHNDPARSVPTRSGSLLPSPDYSPIARPIVCESSSDSTWTHKSPTPKAPSIDFYWTAPDIGDDRMTGGAKIAAHEFQAWVVRSGRSDWINVMRRVNLDSTVKVGDTGPFMCPDMPITACTSDPHMHTDPTSHDVSDGTDVSTHDSMNHMSMSMSMNMPMQMIVVFSTQWMNRKFIFDRWAIRTKQDYVGSIIGVILLGITFEWVQVWRQRLDRSLITGRKESRKRIQKVNYHDEQKKHGAGDGAFESSPLHSALKPPGSVDVSQQAQALHKTVPIAIADSQTHVFSLVEQVGRTFFYLIEAFISLMLMMLVMSMDVGLATAVLSGIMIGSFLTEVTTSGVERLESEDGNSH